MPKHATKLVTPARLVLGAAAAVLVVLVVWVAVRAGGPARAGDEQVIVEPSVRTTTLESTRESMPPVEPSPEPSAVSPSPSTSRAPSASPSPSLSRPAPAAPAPSPSGPPLPAPTPATEAAPVAVLAATYSLGGSWRDGFIGSVRIVNQGDVPQDFTVTLAYPAGAGVRVRSAWNATLGGSGDQVTLRGGPLAAGGSVLVGFQATKTEDDRVSPITCTVGGGLPCKVS